ncbi:MAG: DUF1579 domain-containing protein [Ignavibacteriales bacterium]|nr:DUF1579 domain-containing protein [Ignavibacteriales bacterium]
MKKFILLLICFISIPLMAQDESSKTSTAYMNPGEMHQWLAKSEGDWNFVQETWMMPGTPAMVDSGISKNSMILGGRYLQMIHEGAAFGQVFQGVNLIGYDNTLKKFFSFWIDNLGTGYTIATGDYDKATNTVILFGNMIDPSSGSDWKYKIIMMEPKSGEVGNEMYGYDPQGKEFLMMRSIYTKAK